MHLLSVPLLLLSLLPCDAGKEYLVLGLFPTQEPRGQAQLAGVRVAWEEEVALLNVIPDVRVTLEYNDTKCSVPSEQEVILQHFREQTVPDEQILVVGGQCHRREAAGGDAQKGLAAFVPQVTPEPLPVHWSSPMLSTQLHLGHTTDAIRHFLSLQNWHEAIVISSSDPWYINTAESMKAVLTQASMDIVSIQLQHDVLSVLKNSPVRPVIIYASTTEAIDLLCSYSNQTTAWGRYVWLLPVPEAKALNSNLALQCGTFQDSMIVFELIQRNMQLPSYFKTKLDNLPDSDGAAISPSVYWEAALAYDTAKLVLTTLATLIPLDIADQKNFTTQFYKEAVKEEYKGYTGQISFNKDGKRKVIVEVFEIKDAELINMGAYGFAENSTMEVGSYGPSTVSSETRVEAIPISLFVIMCALAFLGIIYSIAIMAFNIAKQRDKMIKMTSPNINVVILLGCIFAYACIVATGVDSKWVTLDTMGKLMQGSVFTIVLCFTFIYGSVFCKCWRVYLIFKNLNFNGKLTRDEHLLLGVLVMVLCDLVVLLPWTLIDPITCHRKLLTTKFESSSSTDVSLEIDVCSCELYAVWLSVIYIYKLLMLLVGLYFTWQTRNVTLPSLQDAKQVYIVVYTVISLGIVALPVLLTDNVGMTIKYASGSLILFLILTATITLLFMPKVFLFRRLRASASSSNNQQDSFRFLFTESMKKTQDALRRCSLCFCCGPMEEDKYAQEMLATEIDTLKRTIKEKESTIRELTDRLYFGAEKFQEYLKSPKHQNNVLYAMHRKHMRRTQSHPTHIQPETDDMRAYRLQMLQDGHIPDDGQLQEKYIQDHHVQESQIQGSHEHSDVYSVQQQNLSLPPAHANGVVAVQMHHNNNGYDDSFDDSITIASEHPSILAKSYESPSPNHDSAIDNNSPSSDSSDRTSDVQDGGGGKSVAGSAVSYQPNPHHRIPSQHQSQQQQPQPHHHQQQPHHHQQQQHNQQQQSQQQPHHHHQQQHQPHQQQQQPHQQQHHQQQQQQQPHPNPDHEPPSQGRFHSIRLSSSDEPKEQQLTDHAHREIEQYSSPIDLEAMEYDAWPNKQQANKIASQVELEPYRTMKINGVSVSQI